MIGYEFPAPSLCRESWRRTHVWNLVSHLGRSLNVPALSPVVPLVVGDEQVSGKARPSADLYSKSRMVFGDMTLELAFPPPALCPAGGPGPSCQAAKAGDACPCHQAPNSPSGHLQVSRLGLCAAWQLWIHVG
jgi:hypothetical protein